MRYIANTGGAMPTATLDRLRQQLPNTTPFLMYGLTEAFRSTYLPPEELDTRPTSIGKAIPNAEIMVVRDDGSICGPGEPGELVHRGALVSMGYWNDPERTKQRFRPVPGQPHELPFEEVAVWSGDTVVKDEDGFLYFVGRKDDMIKSSGYRISPTELEEVIYGTGLVTDCAALGIPHPELGQAVVIAAHSQQPDDETRDAIILECKKSLPNFMVPAMIVWHESLPRNPNGKIDRKRLAGELRDLFQFEGYALLGEALSGPLDDLPVLVLESGEEQVLGAVPAVLAEILDHLEAVQHVLGLELLRALVGGVRRRDGHGQRNGQGGSGEQEGARRDVDECPQHAPIMADPGRWARPQSQPAQGIQYGARTAPAAFGFDNAW